MTAFPLAPLHPEKNRQPGLHYAVMDDGVEVPVIDVTHPAFHLEPSPELIDDLYENYLRTTEHFRRMPSWLRRVYFAVLRRRSRLITGLVRARGGSLDATTTYLMKLGPKNMGSAYATRLDREIAASFPPFLSRWRLQQIAGFLADGLEGPLLSRPSLPLLLVNIAGGTALDSLNTLLILRKRNPHVLAGREIRVFVLDVDGAGPAFGGRALASLLAPGAPLEGLNIHYEYVPYDWNDVAPLTELLVRQGSRWSIMGVSTEGGLFEYADDEAVLRNLRTLCEASSDPAVLAGSVTLDGIFYQRAFRDLGLRTFPRSQADFRALVQRSCWRVTHHSETPASFYVRLDKA